MPDNTTLDDVSEFFSWGGDTWGTNHTSDPMTPQYYQGTFHTTTVDQAWTRLCWTGGDLTVYGAKRKNHGAYSVVVDNGEVIWGEGYSADPQIQAVLFASQGLQWGDHQIVITNQNGVNPVDDRIWFDVDYVSFVGSPIRCDALPSPTVEPSATISTTARSVCKTAAGKAKTTASAVKSSPVPVSLAAIDNLSGSGATATRQLVGSTSTFSLAGAAAQSTAAPVDSAASRGAQVTDCVQVAMLGLVVGYLAKRFF
ncbi:hypothetical protein IAU60_004644 [Kwoniella sp. DSM 27419]